MDKYFDKSILHFKIVEKRNNLFVPFFSVTIFINILLSISVINNLNTKRLLILLIFALITIVPLMYYRFREINFGNQYAFKRSNLYENPEILLKNLEFELSNLDTSIVSNPQIIYNAPKYLITKTFLILDRKYSFRWFLLEEIVWVYIAKKTTRVNFIPVYDSIAVKIHTNKHDVISIKCGSSDSAEYVLEDLYSKIPNAKFGYS